MKWSQFNGTPCIYQKLNSKIAFFMYTKSFFNGSENRGDVQTIWDRCMWLYCIHEWSSPFNTLQLRQNGCHFTDGIFKLIFFNENVWVAIKISLNFVPKCSINNIPALVQIMAWRRPGDKPLSAPMMVFLLTHIYASFGLNEFTHFSCGLVTPYGVKELHHHWFKPPLHRAATFVPPLSDQKNG